MEMMERLTAVFRRVFSDDSLAVTAATMADDIEAWDSLSHMNLILAVEEEFGVEFTRKEAVGFRNVGELADCIGSKLRNQG